MTLQTLQIQELFIAILLKYLKILPITFFMYKGNPNFEQDHAMFTHAQFGIHQVEFSAKTFCHRILRLGFYY